MFRWLLALVVGLSLFVGSLAVAPFADRAVQTMAEWDDTGGGDPPGQIPTRWQSGPKLVKVATLADALSPKAAAYAEGNIAGCSNQYGWCWVQFCSSWGLASGQIHFVTTRYGYTGTSSKTVRINPGCNNWAAMWFEGNRTGAFAWAGDPVYWIGNGQIQT